jgi:Skp family chaperone for outer membrane proteins
MLWIICGILIALSILVLTMGSDIQKIKNNGEINCRAVISKIDGYFLSLKKIEAEFDKSHAIFELKKAELEDLVKSVTKKAPSKKKEPDTQKKLDKKRIASEKAKALWASRTPEQRALIKQRQAEARQRLPKPPKVIHL